MGFPASDDVLGFEMRRDHEYFGIPKGYEGCHLLSKNAGYAVHDYDVYWNLDAVY